METAGGNIKKNIKVFDDCKSFRKDVKVRLIHEKYGDEFCTFLKKGIISQHLERYNTCAIYNYKKIFKFTKIFRIYFHHFSVI
mgnify:CR=1 FL=1